MTGNRLVRSRRILFVGIVLAPGVLAQTTGGTISGIVYDGLTQQRVSGALITCTNLDNEDQREARSDAAGFYAFLSVSPGLYRVRADAERYQPKEVQDLVVFVASRVDLSFPLRLAADVLDRSTGNTMVLTDRDIVLPIIGPDLERGRTVAVQPVPQQEGTLFSTLSYVIDRQQIDSLPLSGRDVYTMLVTLPGVTADQATGRGLGLSVNGQRPSSSNFLLDGLENNDYLLTGPFSTLAPETIQEYRISTNNFSAEFGQTAGFVANAITRSGKNDLHGLVYAYFNNEMLNANSFLNNSRPDLPRNPHKDGSLGIWTGGRLRRDRLFFSTAFEQLRVRKRENPAEVSVPLPDCIRMQPNADPTAVKLLDLFVPPHVRHTSCDLFSGKIRFSAPSSLNRTLAVERIDYASRDRAQRLTARLAFSYVSQPDFTYSPYGGFNSELYRNARGLATTYTRSFKSAKYNEIRFAGRNTFLAFNRPHPEIPTLQVQDGTLLPGSPNAYELKNQDRSWELADSFRAIFGRQTITAGAGLLARTVYNLLSFGRDGYYSFPDVRSFAVVGPSGFRASVDRLAPDNTQPRYDHDYSNTQFFGFVQDSLKLTNRLNINAGVRYESFGTLTSTSAPIVRFKPGSGSSIGDRIAGGVAGPGPLALPDRNNWAARGGAAYTIGRSGNTVLRAGFGIFYDRPFDSLFLSSTLNGAVLRSYAVTQPGFNYLQPVTGVLQQFNGLLKSDFPFFIWTDERVRTPYTQSWFAAIRRQVLRDLTIEIAQNGALARKLIVSDIVNRKEAPRGNRPNPLFDDVRYRSNSGASDYMSLTASARYRTSRGQLHAAYTYGHSIDNQSEPLLGEFANLNYTAGNAASEGLATFTRQYDSRADRGNSDFDQRQNLVIASIWLLPSVSRGTWERSFSRNWQFATIVGFRSGFPYTAFGCPDNELCTNPPAVGASLIRNRPDLLPGRNPQLPSRPAVDGGVQLLDPTSFQGRTDGTLGSLGRNSLAGPGFWNVDASIARTFALPRGGETRKIQFRADFFNVFNHANLGNPVPNRSDIHFGQALYGRTGISSPLLVIAPLDESARRIQLQLKIYF